MSKVINSVGLRITLNNSKEDINQSFFKYDVAFTFLQQDEDLATDLNNLIKDTVKTFIYIEKQKEIAGRDGGLEFAQVFSKQSRK